MIMKIKTMTNDGRIPITKTEKGKAGLPEQNLISTVVLWRWMGRI